MLFRFALPDGYELAGDVAGEGPAVLLATGERSPPRYALALAALHRLCPEVRAFLTVPDAAHAMQRENAPAFNGLVASSVQASAARS